MRTWRGRDERGERRMGEGRGREQRGGGRREEGGGAEIRREEGCLYRGAASPLRCAS